MAAPTYPAARFERGGVRTLPAPLWWTLLSGLMLVAALCVYSGWAGLGISRGLYLQDFASYVGTGQAVLDGNPLYEPGKAHLPMAGGTFKYTPFAALLFTGLAVIPASLLTAFTMIVNMVLLLVVIWVAFGAAGFARDQGRVAATAGLGAVALGLQPVLVTFTTGNVNIVLMAMILLDLTGRRRGWRGIGIGLAAGIKLVPAFFVVYLLITRQFRAAAVAVGSFAVTVGLGFLFLPHESRYFFFSGNLTNPSRILGAGEISYPDNQTVRGEIARLFGTENVPASAWVPVAVVVGACALLIAALAHRQGKELAAITVLGMAMVLVTPIGWSHYWVWFVTAAVIGVSVALQRRAVLPGVLLGLGYLLLFSWPVKRDDFNVPVLGLLVIENVWEPLLAVLQSLYILLAIVVFALIAIDVLRARRRLA